MKPETHTVQQLFERDVRYNVPLYQRPYVWKRDAQWAPLWDDLATVLEHRAGGDVLTHFLGAIVLEQEATNPGEIPRYIVIDGQQRLTTLQLLLTATAAAMAEVGADDDAALVRDLVLNNPRKAKGLNQLKVWPTNADRAAFTAAVAPVGLDEAAAPAATDGLIQGALGYFTDQVRRYLAGSDVGTAATVTPDVDEGIEVDDSPAPPADVPAATRAEQLRIALCDLLKLVTITLGADDNAQVIFETLNARGTPLLALDLVKNVLFQLAARQRADTDTLYYQVWQPQLDDEYWRIARRQGRLNRPAGELFLVHWLTLTLRDVVPATELFATFRQKVLTPTTDATGLIRTLCNDAAIMRSFDGLAADYDFFARLPALDANIVLPLVLLLFRSPEISDARRRRALRILESWLARRALTRLTAKNYNRQVPRLIDKISADLVHADDILLTELAGAEGKISRWPTDAEVARFLLDNDAYGIVARPRLVMALAAVETSLYSNKTDVHTLPADLTLEHLIPQDWHDHWPLTDKDGHPLAGPDADAGTERRNSRIHRLGNLTLVAGGLNSAMQNAAWTAKRPELNRHSRLLLNARLDEYDSFDEQAVDERGAWLISRILDIWPGPDSDAW